MVERREQSTNVRGEVQAKPVDRIVFVAPRGTPEERKARTILYEFLSPHSLSQNQQAEAEITQLNHLEAKALTKRLLAELQADNEETVLTRTTYLLTLSSKKVVPDDLHQMLIDAVSSQKTKAKLLNVHALMNTVNALIPQLPYEHTTLQDFEAVFESIAKKIDKGSQAKGDAIRQKAAEIKEQLIEFILKDFLESQKGINPEQDALTKRNHDVLRLLLENPTCSNQTIADKVGCSRDNVVTSKKALVRAGFLSEQKPEIKTKTVKTPREQKPKINVSSETKAEIVTYLLTTWDTSLETEASIAKRFKVSSSIVNKLRRKLDLKPRKQFSPAAEAMRDMLAELLKTMTPEEIADMYGISKITVLRAKKALENK